MSKHLGKTRKYLALVLTVMLVATPLITTVVTEAATETIMDWNFNEDFNSNELGSSPDSTKTWNKFYNKPVTVNGTSKTNATRELVPGSDSDYRLKIHYGAADAAWYDQNTSSNAYEFEFKSRMFPKGSVSPDYLTGDLVFQFDIDLTSIASAVDAEGNSVSNTACFGMAMSCYNTAGQAPISVYPYVGSNALFLGGSSAWTKPFIPVQFNDASTLYKRIRYHISCGNADTNDNGYWVEYCDIDPATGEVSAWQLPYYRPSGSGANVQYTEDNKWVTQTNFTAFRMVYLGMGAANTYVRANNTAWYNVDTYFDNMSLKRVLTSSVTACNVADGQKAVALEEAFTYTFATNQIDKTALDAAVKLLDSESNEVAVTRVWDATNRTYTVKPNAKLAEASCYTLTAVGLCDQDGIAVTGTEPRSFYTVDNTNGMILFDEFDFTDAADYPADYEKNHTWWATIDGASWNPADETGVNNKGAAFTGNGAMRFCNVKGEDGYATQASFKKLAYHLDPEANLETYNYPEKLEIEFDVNFKEFDTTNYIGNIWCMYAGKTKPDANRTETPHLAMREGKLFAFSHYESSGGVVLANLTQHPDQHIKITLDATTGYMRAEAYSNDDLTKTVTVAEKYYTKTLEDGTTVPTMCYPFGQSSFDINPGTVTVDGVKKTPYFECEFSNLKFYQTKPLAVTCTADDTEISVLDPVNIDFSVALNSFDAADLAVVDESENTVEVSATLSHDGKTLRITPVAGNWDFNKTYNLSIANQTAAQGNQSAAQVFTFTTGEEPDKVIVSSYAVKAGGKTIQVLTPNENVTVSATFKNISESAQDITMLVGIYDADGRLLKAVKAQDNLAAMGDTADLSTVFTTPTNANTIRMFAWDTTGSCMPMKKAVVFPTELQ